MLYSIKGNVVDKINKNIVVSTTDFDYEVMVANPDDFELQEKIYLYLYHVIREDANYLVGFKSKDEKDAFKLLLNVQGIGPKSAITILGNVNYPDLLVAISNNDLDFVKSIPGVSERVANQILLDLSNFIVRQSHENSELYKEVKDALKALKFKVKDIDKVLPHIYIPNASRDTLLKEALRRLGRNAWNHE